MSMQQDPIKPKKPQTFTVQGF